MTHAKDYITPGPRTLIAGNNEAGYYGSLYAKELGRFIGGSQDGNYITASTLAAQVGITEGKPQNDEITFHKFIFKNEILYIPQKPIRHSISWNHINSHGCVFGDQTIKIGEFEYVMTLMKGLSREGANYYDTSESEWDNLWPLTDLSPSVIGISEIGATDPGKGYWNWCQEIVDDGCDNYRSLRGGWNLAGSNFTSGASYSDNQIGWRPALRLKPQ